MTVRLAHWLPLVRRVLLVCCIFGLLGALAGAANAIPITWVATGTTANFNTAANWNPAQVPGSTDTAIFPNDATLAHIVTVTATTTVAGTNLGGAYDFTVSSGVTYNPGLVANDASGTGTLIKSGAGSLPLSNAANSYTGGTTLTLGVINFVGGGLGPSGPITFNGGTLQYSFSGVNNQDISARIAPVASGKLILIDTNGKNITFASPLSGAGGLTKSGSGTLTLSGANTYSGPTTINGGGALSVSSLNSVTGGSPSSSLGAPTTVANGTIALGGNSSSGTLTYTGSGETTDRVINLAGGTAGSGTGTINQVGTGLLKFTNNVTATGAIVHLLQLQGSTAGTGEIAGAIANNSATNITAVTKAGTGTWALSGTNTYTGATTINAGILAVNGSTTSATTVNNGGRLQGTGTVGNSGATGTTPGVGVVVSSGGVHKPGNSPGIQTVNGSYSLAPGGALLIEAEGLTPGNGVGNYSQVQVNGPVDLNSTGTGNGGGLGLDLRFTPPVNSTFTVIKNISTSATGDSFAQGTTINATDVTTTPAAPVTTTFGINYVASDAADANDVVLTAQSNQTTAVRLISFEAKRYTNGLWVQWKTGLETDNVGFVLLRQDWMQDGKSHKMRWSQSYRLHPSLIAGAAAQNYANADPSGGFSYGWQDTRPLPKSGKVRYLLVDVDNMGHTKLHGPAVPSPAQGSLGARASSPLLTQSGSR